MQQPYVIAAQLIDGMTKINWAWYTREDRVYPLTFRLTKEQLEKYQKRDQNMAKMMTQLNILAKNVMGAGARSVNVVGVRCVNPHEAKFEALCNEEVNFLANQGGGYRANYPRPGVQVGKPKVQSVTHRSGRRARLGPPLDSREYQVGVCKTRRAHGQVGDSPYRSASPTLSAVWTPKLIGGLVKLGEESRLKIGTLGNLASWVELAEPLDGLPKSP
uniref:Gag-pol polyprotein n=1 Tax=Solanum tuberosum TaxID=4113 RepID=M1DZI3_SOLTU